MSLSHPQKNNIMPRKIYMLHAYWFKPEGGKELYKEFMSEALPLIDQAGGKKLRSVVPERALQGEFDADLMYFVEFPSWENYRGYANSSDYHKIAYKLQEAVDKSLLVRCARPGW